MKNITMFFMLVVAACLVVNGNVFAGEVVLSDGSVCDEKLFGGMVPEVVGNGYDAIEMQDRENAKSPRFKAKRVRIVDGQALPTMDAETKRCVNMYGDGEFDTNAIIAGLLMPDEDLERIITLVDGEGNDIGTRSTDAGKRIVGVNNTIKLWRVVKK